MMKNFKIWLTVIAILFVGNLFAQQIKKVELKSVLAVKTRGVNPKIKVDAKASDANPVVKSRGTACAIKFDNYTGLYVKVYVDGYYKGTISPWSDGRITTAGGYTTVYLVSAGGTREWNANGDCGSSWTYTLR